MGKQKSNVFRGLTNVFLAILVIFLVVSEVANSWSGKVNELLGITVQGITRSTDPADYHFQSDYESPAALIEAEIALNTRIAEEGVVALKGSPALSGTKVTLFGMRSGRKMQFGGSMGELVNAANVVTLAAALEANGFEVNDAMQAFYEEKEADYEPTRSPGGNVVSDYEDQGYSVGEVPVSEYDASLLEGYKDAAIVVFGRDAGESSCYYPGEKGLDDPQEFSKSPTGNVLSLSNDERDLLAWVESQGFSQVVVLLNSAGPMEAEEIRTDEAVSSLLWIGNPGAYGTYGIAKLLSGEVLPSGHLPDTFAVNSALSPAAQNFGIYNFANAQEIETTNNNALRSSWYLAELEGIYTGYKYYETRYFDSVLEQGNASQAAHGESVNGSTWNYDEEVSFPFGFGLEGSTFAEEIVDAQVDFSGESDSLVTVKVTNTGDAAAKHAVQLYVSVPYTEADREKGVEKSAVQLLSYAKTGEAKEETFADVVLLAPGEEEEVTLSFNAKDFYSYDKTYEHDGVQGAWTLSAGDYYLATGNGAHDALKAVLGEMKPELKETLAPSGAVYALSLGEELSITESNGVLIQNELSEAELASWNTDAQVTYLSRSDWASTFPVSLEVLTATQEMIEKLRNKTYDAAAELAAYEGPDSFTYGADNGLKAADLVGADYDDERYGLLLDQLTLGDYVKQYIAFLEDLPGISMPKEAPADSPLGFIGTIGQKTAGTIYEVSPETEGYGHYTNVYPGAPMVAATYSPLLQSEEGRLIANDALWTGYNDWFGPGMNLHRTPYNGRNIGYYSEDGVLTGLTALYVHRAVSEKGIPTNTKHFAFNDQETNRDGLAVFLSEQAARENELRGFEIPIRDGSLKGLMSAFNRIGVTHVAAHKGLMNGILRGEWGFNGFVMTDSVKSASYFLPRECLVAGNDMMLGGSNNGPAWGFTEEEVSKDVVLQSLLRESYHRKLYTFVNSAVINGLTPETGVQDVKTWWEVSIIIVMCGSAFFAFLFLILFIIWHYLDKKKGRLEPGRIFSAPVWISIFMTMLGAALFLLSFTTGYYVLGEMKSKIILALLGGAFFLEIISLFSLKKSSDKLLPWLFTFGVTVCLAVAAMMMIGDRVEGIGNCIVTDYDAGHGGEEAIYYSLGGAVVILLGMIYNIMASFGRVKESAAKKVKVFIFSLVAAILAVTAVLATLTLTGVVNVKKWMESSQGGESTVVASTYKASFNMNNGNIESLPDYQFIGKNASGIAKADSRLYIDLSLTLDGKGGYKLFSDTYVVESGKRCVVGDDTGLGQVLTMEAEGSYSADDQGNVLTYEPSHAIFTMQTDTYSAQMKSSLGIKVDGSDEDGVFDSNDHPSILEFVPETTWTLSEGQILTYAKALKRGAFTISYNMNNQNIESMPEYQFLCSDFSGMVKADSRFFVDLILTLDGKGTYTVSTDAYVIESGKRCVIGDDTGLGLVLTMQAEGTYEENEDGFVVTSPATHGVFEMETDTYSAQMKAATKMNVDGNEEDGVYDSEEYPAVLDFVPETLWTLGDSAIETYEEVGAEEEEAEEAGEAEAAEAGEDAEEGEKEAVAVVPSEDGATELSFYADGTYRFFFEAYGIEDLGTYAFEGDVLTLTDANGAEMKAEGDPLALHYVYSQNDQLTGEFSVPAESFAAGEGVAEAEEETEGVEGEKVAVAVVPSEDGATELSFYADGTYRFFFEAYGIEDLGTYAFADGVLTLTDANGAEMKAEGEPLALHYVYSQNEGLTGEFSVSAESFAAGEGVAEAEAAEETEGAEEGEKEALAVVPSEDGATELSFYADGTYRFFFEAYGIEDLGTYAFEGGVLTLTDANGAEMKAEGEPLALHYVYSQNEGLTGEFSVPAESFGE